MNQQWRLAKMLVDRMMKRTKMRKRREKKTIAASKFTSKPRRNVQRTLSNSDAI